MFRKLLTIATTGALALSALVVAPTAASAQPGYGGYSRGYDGYRGDRYRGADRYYGRGYRDGGRYHGRGYYGNRGYYGRGYADRGGRYYGRGGRCRDNGTGGTIIGAIAGGLLGNEIGQGSSRYGRGDGTAGAIVGGGLGALAGRAIDRNC